MATVPKVDVGADYKEKYGFFVPEDYIFKAKRCLLYTSPSPRD